MTKVGSPRPGPSGRVVTPDIRDAERLQGFEANWTLPAEELTRRRGSRWKLVGISGIQLFGGAFFVEPLFNGVTLVVAIALAAFAQRRRAVVKPPRETKPPGKAEESANAGRAA